MISYNIFTPSLVLRKNQLGCQYFLPVFFQIHNKVEGATHKGGYGHMVAISTEAKRNEHVVFVLWRIITDI